MAVQEQTPYIEYTANGATSIFALGFDCESKDHLIVTLDSVEPSAGEWTLTGGAVVFSVAPQSGVKISIQRNTPFSRTTDYQSYNNSFRPGPVNKDFDWIWWKLQELGVADWLLKLYVDQKDSELQENIDNLKNYVDDRDDELRAYLMEEIRKQGVALDQLDEYYNYLMQRLAQIAVDKGWDASFVVDGAQTQKEINLHGGKKYDMPVGGYPVNARVMLNNGDKVKSIIPNNTNNPNVDMTGWVNENDASQIKFSDSNVQTYLSQAIADISRNTNKQRINLSNFGNTGTQAIGSNLAWDNAIAFAKTIAPLITNNIGQSWFDLSGFEFVANTPIYLASQLKLRSTYGCNIHFNIILADNFVSTSSFAIDTSLSQSVDNALNRRPLNTSMYGNINCRYKGNGIYLHDFLHFVLHGNAYNWVSKGVETGTSGNEFIQMPQSTIGQWQYTAGGAADLPAGITSGTAVDINCGDCILLGIVSYYVTRGVRVNGRSCFIGAGAHIYGNRKQALQQTSSGGNLLIDGAWFDASRVELVAEAQMRNCRVFLSSGDSTIGVIINGGNEVSVEGCTFLGVSSGTTAVYRDAAALADKTCVVKGNKYLDGIANSDVRSLSPTVRGETTVGTGTYTNQSGIYSQSDNAIDFTMRVAWSAHDGTGNLIVAGLPFAATQNAVFQVMSTTGTLSPIVAYVLAGASQIRFRTSSGVLQMATSGDLYVTGRYYCY